MIYHIYAYSDKTWAGVADLDGHDMFMQFEELAEAKDHACELSKRNHFALYGVALPGKHHFEAIYQSGELLAVAPLTTKVVYHLSRYVDMQIYARMSTAGEPGPYPILVTVNTHWVELKDPASGAYVLIGFIDGSLVSRDYIDNVLIDNWEDFIANWHGDDDGSN